MEIDYYLILKGPSLIVSSVKAKTFREEKDCSEYADHAQLEKRSACEQAGVSAPGYAVNCR